MDEFDHLISRHGILANFHIAKRVTVKDIKKIKDSLMESCDGDEEEVNKQLEKLIVMHTKSSINKDEIPGLIINGEISKKTTRKKSRRKTKKTNSQYPFDKIPIRVKKKLGGMSFYFTDLIKEEKLTKEQILILFQLIIIECNIKETDIEKFQKKYKNSYDKNEDYLNPDDKDFLNPDKFGFEDEDDDDDDLSDNLK